MNEHSSRRSALGRGGEVFQDCLVLGQRETCPSYEGGVLALTETVFPLLLCSHSIFSIRVLQLQGSGGDMAPKISEWVQLWYMGKNWELSSPTLSDENLVIISFLSCAYLEHSKWKILLKSEDPLRQQRLFWGLSRMYLVCMLENPKQGWKENFA